MIAANQSKGDRVDAELLARLGRADVTLLHPIRHRGKEAQGDLGVIRARDVLVRARGRMVNHVRGVAKSMGARLVGCTVGSFARKASEQIPERLSGALAPLLAMVEIMTQQIGKYDRQIEGLCRERYPETELLRQVTGVGAVTSLAYVLTLEDPHRFLQSRSVGSFLGLRPGQDQSGEQDPELPITKAGDGLLRRLLVQSAQYTLGPFGPDCDLRR